PVELDLADGQVAAQRQADCRADDAGLRERGVHDTVGTELREEAVGDAVHAAQGPDVFAHEQRAGVVTQGGPQALINGLGNGHGGHQRATPVAASSGSAPAGCGLPGSASSANPELYSSNQASSSATSGWASTYVLANAVRMS